MALAAKIAPTAPGNRNRQARLAGDLLRHEGRPRRPQRQRALPKDPEQRALPKDPDVLCLWRAAAYGWVDVVNMLLEGGVNVNKTTASGDTALHIATGSNRFGVVKRLLDHPEIDTNIASRCAGTPLHLACHRGFVSIIVLLLKHPRISANATMSDERGRNGASPLILATEQGHEAAVAVLLAHPGVDPNLPKNGASGFTPLHVAAYYGWDKIARRLLQREDIDREAHTIESITPLGLALLRDHLAIARLLDPPAARSSVDVQ